MKVEHNIEIDKLKIDRYRLQQTIKILKFKMEEKDLFESYNKRLKLYQKKFNRVRIFPFIEIKIKKGGEKKISANIFFDMFIYDTILIPLKYIEIIDEIIDFAVLMSFLPVKFRSNYLSKLLFLIGFKNSEKPQIKDLWNEMKKYTSDTMIKIIFTDFPLNFYLKEITINELLFDFTTQINPIYIEDFFLLFS